VLGFVIWRYVSTHRTAGADAPAVVADSVARSRARRTPRVVAIGAVRRVRR
jgi:hypothetical protein